MIMLQYRMITDAGGREVNEDSVGCFQSGENHCFILCDGLGGHGMGDVASQTVRDVFEDKFRNHHEYAHFLKEAFEDAQNALMQKQATCKVRNRMKTTAVALVTDNKHAYVGHIGDSRLYIFAENEIELRTLDHSLTQMLVLTGEITEGEIRNHPERNILLKSMGIEWEKPMYQLMQPLNLEECQAFLLCSDGFWELITESKMLSLLESSRNVEDWLEKMTIEVRENGKGRKMDNYSAIAVFNTAYYL